MKDKLLEPIINYIPFAGGNLILTLILTVFIFSVLLFLRKPLNSLTCALLDKIAKKSRYINKSITSQIEKPLSLMVFALVWLVVIHFIPPIWKGMGGIPLFLSNSLVAGLKILVKLVLSTSCVWIVYNLTDELIEFVLKRFVKKECQTEGFNKHFLPFINHFVKIMVLCLGILFILQNLGVNVVSLLAGLGIGGIALALAAKDSAANILAYINIMLDRPFVIGDWICGDDLEGTVIEVGIRSTKIKTFYDSVVVVPNSLLINSNIDNMGKRKSRRSRVYLGVEYNTAPQKIEDFSEGIKQILINSSVVKQDYFQVYFTGFGKSELKIIINFFLTVTSWEEELKEKQSIFLSILKLAENLEVNFAFPTQTIHVDSLPTKK